MNNNTKDIYKQMENDDFDSEMADKEIVLQLLKFSTTPLVYMTEDIQKDIEFYRRAVEINGMAIAWDVNEICDQEITLDAVKRHKNFSFFIAKREMMRKLLLDQLNYILKVFFIPTITVLFFKTE